MILSLRRYAAHRKCALSAVQKAIKAGRIKLTNGKVDSEQADRDWQRNTDPAMQRGQTLAAPITRPVPLPPVANDAPEASDGAFGQRASSATVADFNVSRAKKEEYLAELRRLEVEQKHGDLVSLATVNAWVAGMIIRAASILDRIPDEFADRLSQETDPVVIRDLLRTELGRARCELAEYNEAA